MMTPFIPHTCEEAWEAIGKTGYISFTEWPKFDESKIIEDTENNIKSVIDDINAVKKLAKIDKPKNIKMIVSSKWKYDLYSLLKDKLSETRNPKEIIGAVMGTDLKKYGQDVMKIVPKIIKAGSVPEFTNSDHEMKVLEEAKEFFESEFNTEVIIEDADSSSEAKAKQAMPGKPAILIE